MKPLLSPLVELLQDADARVRERCRESIVAIFRSASAAAKADLHRELDAQGVRKQLADKIVADVHASAAPEEPESADKPAADGRAPSIGSKVAAVHVSDAGKRGRRS